MSEYISFKKNQRKITLCGCLNTNSQTYRNCLPAFPSTILMFDNDGVPGCNVENLKEAAFKRK